MRSSAHTDLLLAKPVHLLALEVPAEVMPVGLIGDESDYAVMEEGGLWVNKYQPLDRMFATLMANAMERNRRHGAVRDERREGARVISVYSAVGGNGKTTVAANLAKLHAFRNRRTFYLNLQLLQSPSLFGEGLAADGQSFSKWLYFVQSGKRQLASKLSELAGNNPELKVSFFEPVRKLEEMEQLTYEVTRRLVRAMRDSGLYDELIVDLDAALSEREQGAISVSDEIVWVFTDDIQSLSKTQVFYEEWLARISRLEDVRIPPVTFIMNKYTGTASLNPADFGIQSHVKLPYIPEWKSVRSPGRLLEDAVFQEHLIRALGLGGYEGGDGGDTGSG
ncbi:hypothetical protein [Paenibacillus sp. MBLB4367]|uniref:hypothetical protein n=1 Tax=Paenibacillus sp. MBLB4367 TaxID=3384767 RepID=UPI003907FD1D